MKRCAYYGLVGLVYIGLYARTLGWGWIGLDDTLLLRDNPHLGHSLSALWWAVTDMGFGRRWLPGTWLVADMLSGWGPFGFRLGTFVLGLAMVLSALRLFELDLPAKWAVVPALLFACSPMRMEVFGWSIGFIYCTVALCGIWSWIWYQQGKEWLSSCAAIVALFTYPQAAGLVVFLAWRYFGSSQGFILWAALAYVLVIDIFLRATIGYVPVQAHFGTALVVAPHYVASMFVPLGTVPVVPVGWHWAAFVGSVLCGVAFGVSPRKSMVCLLILAPTIAAAVTESFWFCGRYSILLSLAVLWCLGPAMRTVWVRRIGLLWAGLFGAVTLGHAGFRSLESCLGRAYVESCFLYGADDPRTVSLRDIPNRLRAAAVARGGDKTLSLVQEPQK